LVQKGNVNLEELVNKVMLMVKSKIKPNVLIIEDNPDHLLTLKALLKNSCQIYEAVEGEDGLKKAVEINPDVVLLDIELPKLNGKEIIKILKNNKNTKDIGIIVVTANAMKGAKEDFLKLGADAYISKPIEKDSLEFELQNYLRKLDH
jgi:CheY-like chemotaxis protein